MVRSAYIYNPRGSVEAKQLSYQARTLAGLLAADPENRVHFYNNWWSTNALAFKLQQTMASDPRRMIVYMGHAEPDRLIGDKTLALATDPLQLIPNEMFVEGMASDLLDQALVVAIACHTGAELAHVAIANGVRSWIGAPDKVYIGYNEPEYPFGDAMAASYGYIPMALAQGMTAGEAVGVFRGMCMNLIREFDPVKYGDIAVYYRDLVQKNMEQIRVYGDVDGRW